MVPPSSRYLLRKRPRRRTHASFDGYTRCQVKGSADCIFFTPGPTVHASSSDIAARDEVFQCAASIVSIAAGALLRRSSLPRSPIPAPKRPSIGRVTRPGAAAERSSRMQIAWPSATTRCTQFSFSVRKRGDRADFDKIYARYTPSAHGRTRMIVFPLRRSVRLKAATALSRVAMLPMFVRSRPSRTRWTI